MMRNISFIQRRSLFLVDLMLIPVFVFVIYSGVELHVAGHSGYSDSWVCWAHWHVVAAVLSLVFGGWHVKAHWGWYKSLVRKGVGGKSRTTLLLSLFFLIEIATGVVLLLFVEGGNSAVGMWHYRMGLVMIVFLFGHLFRRGRGPCFYSHRRLR